MDPQREHFPTVLRGDVAMEGGSERCNITSFEDGERGQISQFVYLPASWLECKLPKGQKLVLFTVVLLAPSTVPAI